MIGGKLRLHLLSHMDDEISVSRSSEIHNTQASSNAFSAFPLVTSENGHGDLLVMKDISAIPSNIQPFGSSATDPWNRRPGKVVMISSHPGWPGRRELRGGDDDGEMIAADTVHLTRVFYEVLERVKQGPVLNMDDESVTIGHMIDLIWSRFTPENGTIRLSRILRHARSERAVICMFLALLELLRLEAIVLRQDRHCADLLLRKNSALTG
jgi:hypothetical protein